MATPPSPKRSRHGASPFDIDDSLIDPALATTIEPKEPSPPPPQPHQEEQDQAVPNKQDTHKDDPTYQLALERAYADQRFKATMNHIFEKYGRDFDGIGDEIDLETGEIVVNNGHIRNMRNEADVGDGNTEPLEEDEGMYLGDITDESDEEYQDTKNGMGQSNDDATTDERDSQQQNTAESVPSESVSQAPSTTPAFDMGVNMYDPRFMAMLPALYAGVSATFGWSMPPRMETQPQHQTHTTQQPAPQAFAPPPMPWAPWGMPTDYPMPPWMPPFSAMPQAPAALPFNAPIQRYNFPAQSGRTSVWARNPRYKDDVSVRSVKSSKRSSALSPRSRIQRATPSGNVLKKPAARTDTDSYDGDEADAEQIHPLRSYRRSHQLPTASDLEDDSDYIWEQQHVRPKPVKVPKKRGRPKGSRSKHNLAKDLEANPPVITSKIEIKKRQREELKDKLLAKYYEENPEAEPQAEEGGGRRRSGRDRKRVAPTEEMVSWDRVKAERRAEYKAMMSIRSDRKAAKASNATEKHAQDSVSFESAVSAASDKSPTPEPPAQAATAATWNPPPESNIVKSPIPDSQEITLSQSITGSQQVNLSNNKIPEKLDNNYEALCAFSDDEAPAIIQMRKPKVVQPQPSDGQGLPSPGSDEIGEAGAGASGKQYPETSALQGSGLPRGSTKEGLDYTELFETDHNYTELLDIFPSSSPSPEPYPLEDGSNHVQRATSPTEDDSYYDNDLGKNQPREGDRTTSMPRVMHEQVPSGSLDDGRACAANNATSTETLVQASVIGSPTQQAASTVEQAPQTDWAYKKSSPDTAVSQSSQITAKAHIQNQKTSPPVSSEKVTPERSITPGLTTVEVERPVDGHQKPRDSESSGSARYDIKHTAAITSPITTKNLVILSPKPQNPGSQPGQREASTKLTDSTKGSRSSSSSKRKNSRSSSSKRHSLLSLVGDEDDAEDLGRNNGSFSKRYKRSEHATHNEKERKGRSLARNGSGALRVKKRARETGTSSRKAKPSEYPPEPATSGTCGVDGFICGRDFCFTCL